MLNDCLNAIRYLVGFDSSKNNPQRNDYLDYFILSPPCLFIFF